MHENIEQFPRCANPLSKFVERHYNFVSLGVGEGSKDKSIISNFFNRDGVGFHKNFLYIAVDMSLDMLGVAIKKVSSELFQLPLYSRIAIQRDFETRKGIEEIALIAETLGKGQPILYGFIGNTISNVEKPKDVLNNIAMVMRDEDLLLFEAQIIDSNALEGEQNQNLKDLIRQEYKSERFRIFADPALLQNADLVISSAERIQCYQVEVNTQCWDEVGKLLQIDCFFENTIEKPIEMELINGEKVILASAEKIRLYRSLKFTPDALRKFVETSNLSILEDNLYLPKDTGFMVMMIKGDKQQQN